MQIDKPYSSCTSCKQNMNCSSCLKTLGCGWCYDSNNPIQGVCTGGDFSKPFIGMFVTFLSNKLRYKYLKKINLYFINVWFYYNNYLHVNIFHNIYGYLNFK